MENMFVRFVRDEAGQDLIEYAMIATLVALVVGAGATVLGTNLNDWYNTLAGSVSTWAGKAS